MAKRAIEDKARLEEELRKQQEEKRLAYEEQQRQAEEERIRREQEEQEKLAELQHQVCLSVGSSCATHTSCSMFLRGLSLILFQRMFLTNLGNELKQNSSCPTCI